VEGMMDFGPSPRHPASHDRVADGQGAAPGPSPCAQTHR
jgi:hypothetical protein